MNMEACAAVEKELERVISKFSAISEHSKNILNDVISHIDVLRRLLSEESQDAELSPANVVLLFEATTKTKEKLQRLTTDHRELHGTVSKVGKAIDRNFESDFASTIRLDVLSNERNIKMLDEIIMQHFYRQGYDDVAEVLRKEAGLPMEGISPEPFAELHRIWEAIHNHDLIPALAWATQYSKELEEKNSSLEFKLHRLAFMQILNGGSQTQAEAIAYARTNFAKFVQRFEKEIQTLMGTLMYLPTGIQNSPYRHLMSSEIWIDAANIFIKDACSILEINKDSPLSVVVNSGCTALPALLNLKQVMLSRQVLGIWSGRDELPIEIDLDPENRYHSVFACPILRQQSSDDNPPMKLSCGHAITRDALNKLSNGPLLKCPYCPMEQSPNDAKLIFF